MTTHMYLVVSNIFKKKMLSMRLVIEKRACSDF